MHSEWRVAAECFCCLASDSGGSKHPQDLTAAVALCQVRYGDLQGGKLPLSAAPPAAAAAAAVSHTGKPCPPPAAAGAAAMVFAAGPVI